MSLRQAAEQALEALRYTTDHLPAKTGVERHVDDAITALQIALAKPEMKELTAHDRFQERQRIAEEQHTKRVALAQPECPK